LRPQGLEIVNVALDLNAAAARAVIERHPPENPSLIDSSHLLDELYGVINVPTGIWIDEEGTIVRPPEPAFPGASAVRAGDVPDNLPGRLGEMLREAKKIRSEPAKYVAALRDWAANGTESRYALSPDEVIERSRPQTVEVSRAAAHFELGTHLHTAGQPDAAVPHFREAHRLAPGNWTYRRQAWSLADPLQGPTDLYEGDWLSDVQKIGAENYYPPLEM
jgi:hypothetical protein